jgi:small redox-active disulfide protein 2
MKTIQILGMGCPKCKKLTENVQVALAEAGKASYYKVEKVEDMQKIMSYGFVMTPAIAMDGKLVSSGKILSPAEVKKLLNL